MALGLVDSRGKVMLKSKIPTQVQDGPARILKRLSLEMLRLIALSGVPKSRVRALGVGSPGPLSAAKGLVYETPNLPGWKKVPLVRILARQTGLKVFLENDANCAALGEAAYGAGKGVANVVVLTLGTGVGGGLILNHELYSGPDSTAGELGHFSIDKNGPPCSCGQRGCIELYVSATAMAKRAKGLVAKARKGPLWRLCGGKPARVTAQMAHQALQEGDASAKKTWAEASWALATAVGGYINVFNPDRVILFGSVAMGSDELLEAARRRSRAYPQPLRRAKILRAQLGDDAGLIGAAEHARREMLRGA
jgi:glucokinase